jgi:hypothetical protein
MTTIELKKILIHRISEIEDISFLKAINTILDSRTKNVTLTLTEGQRNEIIASKKDTDQGIFIEHADFDKEVSEWLKGR